MPIVFPFNQQILDAPPSEVTFNYVCFEKGSHIVLCFCGEWGRGISQVSKREAHILLFEDSVCLNVRIGSCFDSVLILLQLFYIKNYVPLGIFKETLQTHIERQFDVHHKMLCLLGDCERKFLSVGSITWPNIDTDDTTSYAASSLVVSKLHKFALLDK